MLKGNKPDFHNAMKAEHSSEMYRDFLTLLGSNYKPDLIKGCNLIFLHYMYNKMTFRW